MSPVPVPIPSSVASRVQVSCQVVEGLVELMDYFIHAIHLRVYGAAAEGHRAVLVAPPLLGDTAGGCCALGEWIHLLGLQGV